MHVERNNGNSKCFQESTSHPASEMVPLTVASVQHNYWQKLELTATLPDGIIDQCNQKIVTISMTNVASCMQEKNLDM